MVEFDSFTPSALAFLRDLKAHNTREWFAEHKRVYEAEIKRPAAAFASAMEGALEALSGQTQTAKIFRINRDIRFSKDKTPYNAHLHIAFSPAPGNPDVPMWFFGLGTQSLTLGCGVFGFGPSGLQAFREDMAGPRGAELMTLIQDLKSKGMRISDPALKTAPRGYDRDHPHAEVLRRKGFAAWIDHPDPGFATQPNLISACLSQYERLTPVYRFLG